MGTIARHQKKGEKNDFTLQRTGQVVVLTGDRLQ